MKGKRLPLQACVALFALACEAAHSQQKTVIQAETRLVLVDAIVTGKKGIHVHDLTAKDFRIWEDNREQVIQSASFIKAATAFEPSALVLFIDETSLEVQDQVAIRQSASRFIDAEMAPNRRMAVVNYNGSLRIAQNFTDNAGRLKEALIMPEANVAGAGKLGGKSVTTASGDLGARNMIPTLGKLAESLNVLPGRKIIVLFAGKLASSSIQKASAQHVIEVCNNASVAVYPVEVRPILVETDSFNPNISSPPRRGVQPHGDEDDPSPAPDSGAAGQQLLFELANGTGGLVVPNTSDLLSGLQSIAAEQSEYYVLSYAPAGWKEGACHTVRVKVDRSGTKIRARTSYCAGKATNLMSTTSSAGGI
jgi:VWFA-related protein